MHKQVGGAERFSQQEAGSLPYEAPADSFLQWRSSLRSAGGIQNAAQIIANFTRSSMRASDDAPSNHNCGGNACTKTEVDSRVRPLERAPKKLCHRRRLDIVCHYHL